MPCGCRTYETRNGDAELDLCLAHEDALRAEQDGAPHGRCECGEPAVLDFNGTPLGSCNDCRDDGWFRCESCGETYRKIGIGALGYVVTVEGLWPHHRTYRCHDCAREHFARTPAQVRRG